VDVLWFKLAASPRFAAENVFCSIVNDGHVFSIFHGAEEGKLHLAWAVFADDKADDKTDWKQANWAEIFASLSPSWMAEHLRSHADTIETPIKLSVVVGRCPCWHAPGLLLLGDAAHPMSPVRAQGINVALRDVIVTANHLVPLFDAGAGHEEIDTALSRIQAEREPEIIRIQQLQAEEAAQGEQLRKNALMRWVLIQLAPLLRKIIQQFWLKRQYELREGITQVHLSV
jgi:2-polyprenyl-6-methoxyphenol hydroxylase-like FAD-dependent oxidoreductase